MKNSAYKRGAQFYDRLWGSFTRKTHERVLLALDFKRLNGQPQPVCLLDLACGTGELERQLVGLHPEIEIIGLDSSPEMLAQARRKFAGQPHLTFVEGNASHALPFSDASFDIVVSANAMHYLAQPGILLQEIYRVLKPGGQLVIEDFTVHGRVLWPLFERLIRLVDPQHYQTYTFSELNRFLSAPGFNIVGGCCFKIDFFWRGMFLSATRPL